MPHVSTVKYVAKFPIAKFSMSGLSRNTGVNFENRIADLLFVLGWTNINMTPRTGDYGGDILATTPDGYKCVIQCKRYSGNVSADAVDAVYTACDSAYKRADIPVVITNSHFTKEAIIKANSLRRKVILIDGDVLADMVNDANKHLDSFNQRYMNRR